LILLAFTSGNLIYGIQFFFSLHIYIKNIDRKKIAEFFMIRYVMNNKDNLSAL